MSIEVTDRESFREFYGVNEAPIRYALVAEHGYEVGREACAEALAYAWENWERVRKMGNPAGYIYRIGQRRGRRMRRQTTVPYHEPVESNEEHDYEPELERAMGRLSRKQLQAVLLVHGAGWSVREAAGLLNVSPGTVQNHLERGMRSLRQSLGVSDE